MALEQEAALTPDLLTARDVARRLSLSERCVWKMAAARKIPSPVKLGGATRWRRAELESFVANGCRMGE